MSWAPPPAAAAPAARVRAVLDAAGYDVAAVSNALGGHGRVLLERTALPVARRTLAENRSSLATLIRLFLLGEAVEAASAQEALGGGLEAFAALELVREEGGSLTGTVELVPHDDLIIASDRRDHADDPDVVPGLHRPSATLGSLTVRQHVRRALDVGTGNGIQALLLAPYAETVVATDVNERALAFAQLNASLNGRTNIEVRHGSFLEPVAGERFDLIVSNPPYVISPETRYVFRDSGLGGDRVSAELVAALPGHLEPGGFATVMISWIQEGDTIGPRVKSWLDGGGCDGLLLHATVSPALSAASSWNRELAGDDDRYVAAVDEWLAYFRTEGIEAIGYGAVVLRRRERGDGWFQVLELPERVQGQASAQLHSLFRSLDAAHEGDAELLGRRLAAPPHVRLVQTLARGDDGWAIEQTELGSKGGIELGARLDPATTSLLRSLDGSRTVGDVLSEAAVAAGAAPADAVQGLPVIRRLLTRGFLAPSE